MSFSFTATDDELIVWGGSTPNAGATVADGAAYDVEKDTWRTLAESPLSPRRDHAAAWTGTDLFLWGGHSGEFTDTGPVAEPLRDGALYQPDTDTWTLVPEAPLTGGPGYVAVWTGDEVVVLGGNDGTSETGFAEAAAFDPVTGQWRPLRPIPSRPLWLGAEWSGSEIVIAGVQTYLGGVEAMALDPAIGTWRSLGRVPISPAVPDLVVAGDAVVTWAYDPEDRGVAVGGLAGPAWTEREPMPGDPSEGIPQAVAVGDVVLFESEGWFSVLTNNGWVDLGEPPPEMSTTGPLVATPDGVYMMAFLFLGGAGDQPDGSLWRIDLAQID